MNIIICGAGRVGFTIAKQLSEQGRSITVIDPSSDDIQKIDDAFLIKNNTVVLKTENYTAKIMSSIDNNYLQIYTPKNHKAIAVEPMTGVSDSFNNGIGLRQLDKNEKYEVDWLLDVVA